jgi:hypothetical protein
MILPTIQIPISLDIFGFHLMSFTKDYQLYISDERIAVKTEKKKDVCDRYEILFCEEYNIVNNYPGAIFGQIESLVTNDTLIEIRAAIIRMEEVPIAADFFSKFYQMVINKWDVIHGNISLSNEFIDNLYMEEVNPEVDTGWNGEGDAVVYAYRKLIEQSGIDSKYLPHIPYEINLDWPRKMIMYEPIEDPLHHLPDDPDFGEKYFDFKDELNNMLFPFTESNNTALANQTKRGKQGPPYRIKKLAECVRRLKEKNQNLSRDKAAKDATKILYDEIWNELWDKDPSNEDNEINEIAEGKFYKEYKTKNFTQDNVRYAYKAMGWDDWKPAKKGK